MSIVIPQNTSESCIEVMCENVRFLDNDVRWMQFWLISLMIDTNAVSVEIATGKIQEQNADGTPDESWKSNVK